jgi:hypothetical protein
MTYPLQMMRGRAKVIIGSRVKYWIPAYAGMVIYKEVRDRV